MITQNERFARVPCTHHQRTRFIAASAAFAVLVLAFWAWWPLGIILGLIGGTCVVVAIGTTMTTAAGKDVADSAPTRGEPLDEASAVGTLWDLHSE